MLLLEFENGARGSIHVTSLAYEPGPFGHRHEMDLHGSAGTLAWTTTGSPSSGSMGAGGRARDARAVPRWFFAGARRGPVHDTYRDVFREQDNMTRGFVSAVARERAAPDFSDGLAVQRLLEAASRSAQPSWRSRRSSRMEAEA